MFAFRFLLCGELLSQQSQLHPDERSSDSDCILMQATYEAALPSIGRCAFRELGTARLSSDLDRAATAPTASAAASTGGASADIDANSCKIAPVWGKCCHHWPKGTGSPSPTSASGHEPPLPGRRR